MKINVNVKEAIINGINDRYAHYKPMIYDNNIDTRHRCLALGRCEGLTEALSIVLACFDSTEQISKDLKEQDKEIQDEKQS